MANPDAAQSSLFSNKLVKVSFLVDEFEVKSAGAR